MHCVMYSYALLYTVFSSCLITWIVYLHIYMVIQQLSTLTWRELCMLAFLASCRDPQKAVIPSTAFAYLSAVRKFLEDNGIDTDFFENSQYIRNTKAGMVNAYRAELNRDKPSRLAITVDMIVGSDIQTRKQLGEKYGLAQLAVHTAQLLGYTTLS